MSIGPDIRTLVALKASGYTPSTVKDEVRRNLMRQRRAGEHPFDGIVGYEHTVVPQIENALLSRHDFILLGLRGQAKTRLLRQLTRLLDEHVPAVDGCEINDDPLAPVCRRCRRLAAELGDDLPVRWMHREERYHEKLATPDVTIADLIGDVDPIKATRDKLSFGDEEVLHFGIVPRTHRGIFALNELPEEARLGLPAQAEQDEIVAREQRVLDLRHDRVLVAHDAVEGVLAGAPEPHEVAPHLVLDGARAVPRGLQRSQRPDVRLRAHGTSG